MKNTYMFYIVFQVLRKYFSEKLQDTATSSFIFCCFKLVFVSADIIFYNFLKIHSTLSEQMLSKISFFNRYTQTPPTP